MFKALRKKLKDQRGLTLIELLAVIVILGIIAAIAVPSIGGIINKTKEDAKVAEAIQIISAAKLFVATSPKVQTISRDDLVQYLDNTKDDAFTVSVTQNKDTKKYEYVLNDHEANDVLKTQAADGLTEAELLAY